MDQQEDSGVVTLSKDLQSILFHTEFVNHDQKTYQNGLSTLENGSAQDMTSSVQLLDVEPQSLDRWVPEIRKFIEDDNLDDVLDELQKSIQDNFQDANMDFFQNPQINDQLMNSIENLSKIQTQLHNTQLQEQLRGLQKDLSQYTEKVIFHKQLFLQNKKTNSKIKEATILINKILQILELSNNCHQLILSNQFFRALQSLDSLEIIYSQDFRKEFNFDFLSQFYQSIPLFKEIIRDESINLIKKFFNSNLEKVMDKYGSQVFESYQKGYYQDWLAQKAQLKLPSAIKFNSSVEISLRDDAKQRLLSPAKWFDLEAFNDAILIFTSMNQMSYLSVEFGKIYEFWENKFVYPLEFVKNSVAVNLSQQQQKVQERQKYSIFKTVSDIKGYLLKITGFLVFDKFLQRETDYTLTEDAFTSTAYFWETFCKNFLPYLKFFITYQLSTKDLKSLNEMNQVMGIFISIFSNLKLDTKSFYTCHVQLFEKYCAYEKGLIGSEFTQLLKDDDFMPLSLNDKALYSKVMKLCWLKESDKEVLNDSLLSLPDEEFSVALPFSPLYPMTCSLLKKSETRLHKFVEEFFPFQTSLIYEKIINSVDSIFQDVIIVQFEEKLGSKSREELLQVLINLDYFYISTIEMAKILSHVSDQEVQLSATNKMRKVRDLAETKLIELIDSKVSDLMEIIDLDWTAQLVRNEPDLIISDIADYLYNMFTSTLANLPYQMKTLIIFREFDALTSRFLNMLVYGSPATITPQSVLNFETDINCLEDVIASIFGASNSADSGLSSNDSSSAQLQAPPTPTIGRESSIPFGARSPSMFFTSDLNSTSMESNIRSLRSTFDDLKQHIRLLKSGSLEQYKTARMKIYPRVKPEVANMLINKLSTYQLMLRERQEQLLQSEDSSDSSSVRKVSASNNDDSMSLMSSRNKKKIAKFFGR